MNDKPTQDPPYIRNCREMDFTELSQYIEHSLNTVRSDSITDRPKSKREFLHLLGMLRKRLTRIPASTEYIADAPLPEKPPEKWEPSDQLVKLKGWITNARRRLSRSNPDDAEEIRKELQALKQEVSEQEKLDREAHEKQAEAYNKALRLQQIERREFNRIRDGASKRAREKQSSELARLQALESRVEAIFRPRYNHSNYIRNDYFTADERTSRLSWSMLPSGSSSKEAILRHSQELRRHGLIETEYDEDRLEKAFSLKPEQCYVGRDESSDYIIFTFSNSSRALMECPIKGNAIYVVDAGDWERLSRMTKQQLQELPSTTRIVHRGEWFEKLRQELGFA